MSWGNGALCPMPPRIGPTHWPLECPMPGQPGGARHTPATSEHNTQVCSVHRPRAREGHIDLHPALGQRHEVLKQPVSGSTSPGDGCSAARGGQALLFLWTSHWEHRADEPGQEGVSILHTLNTSAEDSDMWRGAVIKSPNKVGRSRIRAGRGLRAQEGQTGCWQSLQVLLLVHLQGWNPGNATANPKWEHGEQTGQWRLGT